MIVTNFHSSLSTSLIYLLLNVMISFSSTISRDDHVIWMRVLLKKISTTYTTKNKKKEIEKSISTAWKIILVLFINRTIIYLLIRCCFFSFFFVVELVVYRQVEGKKKKKKKKKNIKKSRLLIFLKHFVAKNNYCSIPFFWHIYCPSWYGTIPRLWANG